MNRTALFAKKTPGGVLAIEDMARGTGDRWFVDSGATYASDATEYGTSPDKPFATLDYAIGQASANNGDIIYVMPGHAESYGSGEGFTADVAGLTVVCLGEGADRPTFTFAATDATCTVTAASFKMTGFLFLVSIDAVVTYVTVTGADCELAGEIRDTTDKEVVDGFTVSGDRFKARIVHRGYTSGDANDSTIALDGVDGADIYVEAYGKAGVGVVDMRSHACANVVVDGIFLVTSTTDFSKTVVDTVTGSTYKATGFDVAAGKRFSGNGITAKHSIDDFTVSTLGAGAIVAATLAADTLQAIQDESEDALEGENLDHLAATAVVSGSDLTAEVIDGSVISNILTDDGDTSNYDRTKMSLEAIAAALATRNATGSTCVDEGDYDWTSAYPAILTIAPAAGAPLADVEVYLDMDVVTTGFATIYAAQTIQFYVERKVDGTNWRRDEAVLAAALAGNSADTRMVKVAVGHVGVSEQARITAVLSAEVSGAAETDIPYAVYYKGAAAPTVTPLTATP